VAQDDRAGIIAEYLDKPLPEGWHDMGLEARRTYLSGAFAFDGAAVQRDTVCAAEVAVEALGVQKGAINRYVTREINDIMRTLTGWRATEKKQKFPLYGTQRIYTRI
jgi:hypothetical protein